MLFDPDQVSRASHAASGAVSLLRHNVGIEISGAFLVVTHCPFAWMIFGESVRSDDRAWAPVDHGVTTA
jgi:hypothetical protein